MAPLDKIFKKVQEVHKVMGSVREELENTKVEADAGAGLVKVIANGNQEILEISIDKELINMKDKKLLEDLLVSAINSAKNKAQEKAQEVVRKLAGNLDMKDFQTLLK